MQIFVIQQWKQSKEKFNCLYNKKLLEKKVKFFLYLFFILCRLLSYFLFGCGKSKLKLKFEQDGIFKMYKLLWRICFSIVKIDDVCFIKLYRIFGCFLFSDFRVEQVMIIIKLYKFLNCFCFVVVKLEECFILKLYKLLI